ncbi:hypothetical protein HPB49_013820 [Dermacentor silvarum]|uniref:Uncharacterized protein n=1 Tax=Dermacentor silvarum TaxID=543639 RepID=A0ACB8CFF2_DERSI|nr:hypothetical protein HPB49_013820 [Dermacentor silvarum]
MYVFCVFEGIKIPSTIGCVDGSYISIRCPAGKVRSVYGNRHHYPSVTLQGICDNKKRFLDVSTGAPSKMHDSRIFRRSRVANLLPQLCSSVYHIVGDAAYPFREHLMTPIRDYGNLDCSDRAFNARMSGTRILIENAFGDLKNRFRQLHRLDMWTVDNMSKFIISCCVLHNLCIEQEICRRTCHETCPSAYKHQTTMTLALLQLNKAAAARIPAR